MAIDIGRVMLELLAAIVIQFTPVDSYANGFSRTWGDQDARWYIMEVTRKGDSAQFDFSRFDGEVRSSDTIRFYAKKGSDGKFVWTSYKRDTDTANQLFSKPVADLGRAALTRNSLAMTPWQSTKGEIPLQSSTKGLPGNAKATVLQYKAGELVIGLAIDDKGLVGISLSSTGLGYTKAENVLTIEGKK